MSEYLAFACKTEDRGSVIIEPNDFSSGDPNALIALGVLPTISTGFVFDKFQVKISVPKFSVLDQRFFDLTILLYTVVGNSVEYIRFNVQPTEVTITDKPITICGQPVTNSVGFVIRITGEYTDGVGLTVGNQYAISLGFNPAGKLLSQVIITRSKSSTV